MRFFSLIPIFSCLFFCLSCHKPPGPGGKASVKGKIYVKDFNTSAYGPPIAEYYGVGETIYISYGNNPAVGNTAKSGADGSFEFPYLRTGHYEVYIDSRDTSIHMSGSNKTIPVKVSVDITQTKQVVDLGDIIINK